MNVAFFSQVLEGTFSALIGSCSWVMGSYRIAFQLLTQHRKREGFFSLFTRQTENEYSLVECLTLHHKTRTKLVSLSALCGNPVAVGLAHIHRFHPGPIAHAQRREKVHTTSVNSLVRSFVRSFVRSVGRSLGRGTSPSGCNCEI